MGRFLLILIGLICLQCRTSPEERFMWLIGTWKLEGREAYETWRIAEQSPALIGKAFRIQAGDTVVTETITLDYFDGSFHFIPDVAGDQGPIDFVITTTEGDSFIAENPQHDFPKVIQYSLQREGETRKLKAAISGNGEVIAYSYDEVK